MLKRAFLLLTYKSLIFLIWATALRIGTHSIATTDALALGRPARFRPEQVVVLVEDGGDGRVRFGKLTITLTQGLFTGIGLEKERALIAI